MIAVENLKEQVEKQLENIATTGIQSNNVDLLYKLIDIHKDISQEKYWDEKIKLKKEGLEMRRYREGAEYNPYGREEYGNYGREQYGRRRRDSRGRFMEGGSYGHDDGEQMMDEMMGNYQSYRENMSYGAEQDGMKSLNKMLESAYEFVEMLTQDAKSQEEVELIKKWTRKMSQL